MDGLTIFGLVAVTAMLVCYALEHQNRWFILAFADADACGCGSVYGFLRGAGPFGLVEAIWAGGAAAMGESGPETLTPPGPRSCEEPRTFRPSHGHLEDVQGVRRQAARAAVRTQPELMTPAAMSPCLRHSCA